MFDEEENTKKTSDEPIARNLEDLSVEDMREYIDWLNQEAKRVAEEIETRGSVKTAAEALFS